MAMALSEEDGGGLFDGLRFRLFGFDTAIEDQYRESIKQEGGMIEKKYIWKDVHVVVSTATMCYSDEICLAARSNGAVLTNELWLEDSLSTRVIAETDKILYRPPLTLDYVIGAGRLKIAYSGFSSEESSYLEKLIQMIGAQKGEISNSLYLICERPEGDDYNAGIEKKIFTVNKQWLEDCVKEWEILSIDNYVTWHTKQTSRKKYRTPVKDKDNVEISIPSEVCTTGKKRISHGETSRGSPETTNSIKRPALSTGRKKPNSPPRRHATTCRRSLDFNWRRLSDFNKSELLVTLLIPESKLKMEVATDIIKEVLLVGYRELLNMHARGDCIRNALTLESIRVSPNSEQAKFEGAQLVEYDVELAKSNKDSFVSLVQMLFNNQGCSVPEEIVCWLSCITDRLPDRLVTRHINMLEANDVFAKFVAMFYLIRRLKKNKDQTKYFQVVSSLGSYLNWKNNKFAWPVLTTSLTYVNPNQLEVHRLRSRVKNYGGAGLTGCTPKPPQPKVRDPDVFGLLELL